MNVLYLYVIPIGELATLGGKSVLDVVADRLLGGAPATSWRSSRSSASRPASTP